MPDAIFWGRRELDLRDTDRIRSALLRIKPTRILNAAAYTAVDKAESEPEIAYAVNTEAVAQIARAAEDLGSLLIHISTDYVFAGESRRPYREDDPVFPLNVYGRTKLAGEVAVQTLCERHWIFRTSWVFCEYGANFVKTMLRLASGKSCLSVVDDQRGRPTYAGDIADTMIELLSRFQRGGRLPWGIWHIASRGESSWYEFAQAVFAQALRADLLKKAPELKPIATKEYPTAAIRSAYSTLDTARLENFLGRPLPEWSDGLERMMHELKREKGSITTG